MKYSIITITHIYILVEQRDSLNSSFKSKKAENKTNSRANEIEKIYE